MLASHFREVAKFEMPVRRRSANKGPQQERSKATFEAIVQAATHVFSSKGYEAATMTGIAAAAGVAIGSLYQYASTKRELATHVMRRKSAEIMAHVDKPLLELGSLPLAQAVPKAVRLIVEAHRMHARLPNLAIHELAEHEGLSKLREFERRAAVGLRVYLEAHRAEIKVENLELAVVLMTHMTDAAVHAAMARNSAWLETDELAEELSRLWLGYLAHSQPDPQAP